MNIVRTFFFQNQGTFLWILKKGRGDLPPPPPPSLRAWDKQPHVNVMNFQRSLKANRDKGDD